MNLFDDHPQDDVGQRRTTCCDDLAGMPRLDQFIHVLGHSRVPFTPLMLAALTDQAAAHVIAGIAKAIDIGWIGVVEPEEYMQEATGLYVGQLSKRR